MQMSFMWKVFLLSSNSKFIFKNPAEKSAGFFCTPYSTLLPIETDFGMDKFVYS